MKQARSVFPTLLSSLLKSWSTVKDLKDAIQQILHVPPSAQRLFFGPLMTSSGELPNYRTLHDAGIYKSDEILLLDIKGGDISGSSSNKISSLHGTNDVELPLGATL
jgi:hypothetical protein